MAQQRVVISSEWGNVSANLSDNDAAQVLYKMLPLTLHMSDHLRQEKTGNLPSPLPSVARQREFLKGTLGLWSSSDFVIYYRDGSVPQPGITILGKVQGDVSIFDRPGEISITIERAE
ncbi:cyclophilin-like fold protein [Rhizobium sp. Leaf386]|uniref:cyclophilin-like fold protein n=1 Tax=Rhizobium sp. Leaf386 TaxID=1736359 RepID=UPI001FCCF35C|nr:cyclophilin-like fold protein [Rhizobium sp. Leaf386]